LAFYQKYRSQTFSELLGQAHISETLKEAIRTDKMVHSYLFTGPRGIGKTSSARILARAINCLSEKSKKNGEPCNECESCKDMIDGRSIDVTEIDAASHTGVDDIRELIDRARLLPIKNRKKVYIIDEVHMLSKSAFNALLKTLEEPPAHVVFIMATTEVQKIPATILSRAQRYDFKRASHGDILINLKHIAKEEKIKIDDESLDLIALSADGGHRDSISLFEQVAAFSANISITDTRHILGVPDTEQVFLFLRAIFNNQPEEGLKIAHALYEDGVALAEFNKLIIETLRKTLLLAISGKTLFEDTKENIEKIKDLAKVTSANRLNDLLGIFIQAGNLLKDVAYPILPLEMAVIEASQSAVSGQRSAVDGQPSAVSGQQPVVRDQQSAASGKQPTADCKPQTINSQQQSEEVDPQTANCKLQTASGQQSAASGKQPTADCKPQTVAIPVLEMTDDTWHKVIDMLKVENASLAALLKDAKPLKIDKDEIILGVKFSFHKDRISEPKNSKILEKVISDIMGNNCRISCELADLKPKPKESITKEKLKETVDEIFEE